MAGEALVVMTNDAEINTTNLMHNFYYLENYLSAIAVNASLIQGVALDTDFRDAVADALAMDLDSFIPNLATAIYGISDFVGRVVTAQDGVGGETFDGLAYNNEFIENLVISLVDSAAFINSFLTYFDDNTSSLYNALKSSVFRSYYGPDINEITFATSETGSDDIVSLWETGEPDIVGDDATKYIGITFGLDDNLSDINLLVSKNSSFPVSVISPGTTDTMRFTHDGSDVAGATGYVHAPFFDANSGGLLLDISALVWSGAEELYIKLIGTKSNLTLIRVGFDYAKHASQTNAPASIVDPGALTGIDLSVDSQEDWERLAGADGAPEVSDYYNTSSGNIELPNGLRVVMTDINASDYGVAGEGYVWDRSKAYTMHNPIYIKGNFILEGQGTITIVKRDAGAIFICEPKLEVAAGYNNYDVGEEKRIDFVFDEGEVIEGDVLHYEGTDEYYTVVEVYPTSNYVLVDRDLGAAYGVPKKVTLLYQNVNMSGFYFDGRGGLLPANDTPLSSTFNNGGGFANLTGLANSVFDVSVINAKASNGGAFYMDRCINVQVRRAVRLCEADGYPGGGYGGAVYGGTGIKAEASMCKAYAGGGFSDCKFSTLRGYKNSADTLYAENFYNCSFSKEIQFNNFDSLKIIARVKVDTKQSSGTLTELYTVPTGVKTVIADFFVTVSDGTGITDSASISIGNNPTPVPGTLDPYNNLFDTADIQVLNKSDNETYQPERSFGKMAIYEDGDVVQCRLDTPATGTTQVVEIVLCGYEYLEI